MLKIVTRLFAFEHENQAFDVTKQNSRNVEYLNI